MDLATIKQRMLADAQRRLSPGQLIRWWDWVILALIVAFVAVQATEQHTVGVPLLVAYPLVRFATRADRFKSLRRRHQVVRGIIERGVLVRAVLVQANQVLFRPGKQAAPCLVLICFAPEVEGDAALMLGLAERMGELKGTDQQDPELRYAAEITTNERAVMYRRRRLPPALAGDRVVYAADLYIWHRSSLKDGYIRQRFLPCLAEPGEEGGIELVPYWIMEGRERPS